MTTHGSGESPWTVPPQSAALTALKGTGVVVASALLVAVYVRTVAALDDGWALALFALAGLVGYSAADLLSGTAHWFCDTFFKEDTPLIGRTVIRPFREHHVHPQRIVRYGFLEQDTTNFFLMIPLLAAALWWEAPRPGSLAGLFWCSALLGLATGAFGTNLFHRWAHEPEPPRPVRWMQRIGLILGPRRHGRHHGDHTRAFCVTSGWMNPLLDAVRFFPRVEAIVRRLQR